MDGHLLAATDLGEHFVKPLRGDVEEGGGEVMPDLHLEHGRVLVGGGSRSSGSRRSRSGSRRSRIIVGPEAGHAFVVGESGVVLNKLIFLIGIDDGEDGGGAFLAGEGVAVS